MKITAFVNNKGGVGKTAVTTHLAESHAAAGERVLAIDNDSQGNLTSHFGIVNPEVTLKDVLVPVGRNVPVQPGSITEAITAAGPEWPAGLLVVPSDLDLHLPITNGMIDFFRLRDALQGVEGFDRVLIDCPPNVGVETSNAINAADDVLIVTTPRADSVAGIRATLRTLAEIRGTTNPGIRLGGIIVNQVKTRSSVDQREWMDYLTDEFGAALLEPHISESEVFTKAKSAAMPLRSQGRAAERFVAQVDELSAAIRAKG